MPLTIDQLFVPTPSGVGLNPALTPATATWYADYLTMAGVLGLPTTAWQPGGPERTILADMSLAAAQLDVSISIQAQGTLLQFAAFGTVTSTDVNGDQTTQKVTPDPSIPSENPDGAPGWLDAIGQGYFQVDRLQASYAEGPLYVANTAPGTITYAAKGYHVANSQTKATYSNLLDITVPTSAIAGTGGVVTGITPGSPITILITQTAHGCAVNDVIYLLGITGTTGLNGVFAIVTAVTATTITIQRASAGAWTGGGVVYKCSEITAQADALGLDGNAASGAVTTTITQSTGVFVSNVSPWSAANYESNGDYLDRILLKLGALSPDGPKQAYDYVARTAYVTLAEQTPAVALTNGPVLSTTFSNPQTGIITCVVASSSPASTILGEPVTPGCAQLPIFAASNTTPIQITTISPHGLHDGDAVVNSGVIGNYAANGAFTIGLIDAQNFTLNDSVGDGVYVAGSGVVDGGDLGQIDNLIQQQVVPDGIAAAYATSALAFPITVSATVVVPKAYVATYKLAAPRQLLALIATYPMGGNIPPGESAGTVPYSAIEGALVDAGSTTVGTVSYVRSVSSLLINGVSTDLVYPAPEYQAILSTVTLNVVGV